MVSRTDNSRMAEWWRTVERKTLGAVIGLMLFGLMLSFGASPPVAERIGADYHHFVQRHALFLIPALAILIGCSFLSPRDVRRVALILFVVGVGALLLTLFIGSEAKGSQRWIQVAGFTLQPSEFVKPAFVVICAWLFAENSRRADIPGNLFAIILLGIVAALLVAQPDFGQTFLVAIVWGALFFLAGMSWQWIAGLGFLGLAGMGAAYTLFPHVASRINRFVTGEGDNFQVETALDAITNGGWLGRGPGEGTVKNILPDGHTDFSFAVAAEEFGIVVCIVLVLIYGFIVVRGLLWAHREHVAYIRLATAGLLVLFAIQSVINIAVTLQLMPAKGMTLPFISYGGSSLLSMSICMGFVLALTRRRPETRRADRMSGGRMTVEPAE